MRKPLVSVFNAIILCAVAAAAAMHTVRAEQRAQPLKVVFVFAHPDDETWINGTIAKLAQDPDVDLHIFYVTSGNEGGVVQQMFHGPRDANATREGEARAALRALGVKREPEFLQYAHVDPGKQYGNVHAILTEWFKRIEPDVVVTFGADGVTGHLDHIVTGLATTRTFDYLGTISELYYIAVSRERAQTFNDISGKAGIHYKVRGASSHKTITNVIDVKPFTQRRMDAVASHPSQFDQTMQTAWEQFTKTMFTEELIRVRANREEERFSHALK